MKRAYYSSSVNEFIVKDIFTIFGEITCNDQFAADDLQKNTWKKEIGILKRELSTFKDGHLLFEYTIPRIGSRIDNVLIYKGIVFLLEFKVDEDTYPRHAIEQVTDYALDLNCFHKESHDKLLVPILICTKAPQKDQRIRMMKENILETYCCNEFNIGKYIKKICTTYNRSSFNSDTWINSLYMPTPTIIEAAQALYMGHNVEDISRNDASAKNLNQTTKAINKIIDYSKTHNRKSICFITGVPGAGKTLAGLNIAIERQKVDENEHAVFLSGNGPLVDVLQEALARDDVTRNGIRKSEAIRKAKEFIQIIHHFRDEAISVDTPPIERVTIFDEAQRAWDEPNLTNFMKRKKGVLDFNMSEPEFLISILNRHIGWATIV
ncbi:MAG: DNA/RNA helicase domain-containing protein, partial [Clostridioides difficile]|nr:DNA/RNA helicase domain-containing protein [Clostridioides difficile]